MLSDIFNEGSREAPTPRAIPVADRTAQRGEAVTCAVGRRLPQGFTVARSHVADGTLPEFHRRIIIAEIVRNIPGIAGKHTSR